MLTQSKYSLFQSNHLQKTGEAIAKSNGSSIYTKIKNDFRHDFPFKAMNGLKFLTPSTDVEGGIIILTD